MKFDVIIGNPPYQESNGAGQSGGTPLFDKFIVKSLDISNRCVCMIFPSKWMAGTQGNMVTLRKKLTEGSHIKRIVDYMDASIIFPGTSIAGGVQYLMYDNEYVGDTDFTTVLDKEYNSKRSLITEDGLIPRHAVGQSVIEKIKEFKEQSLSVVIYKDKWGIPTDFVGNTNRQETDNVSIYTPRGWYHDEYYGTYLNSSKDYKVMFGRIITEHAAEPSKNNNYTILSSLNVLKPFEICNASYMVVDGISKEEYAQNIISYLKTKFVRFLILQTLFGIGLTPDRFRFIPIQDFSKSWTDIELYEKYKLDEHEIKFIEKIIKPMN